MPSTHLRRRTAIALGLVGTGLATLSCTPAPGGSDLSFEVGAACTATEVGVIQILPSGNTGTLRLVRTADGTVTVSCLPGTASTTTTSEETTTTVPEETTTTVDAGTTTTTVAEETTTTVDEGTTTTVPEGTTSTTVDEGTTTTSIGT